MDHKPPRPLDYAPAAYKSPFERMPGWLRLAVYIIVFAAVIIVIPLLVWAAWIAISGVFNGGFHH